MPVKRMTKYILYSLGLGLVGKSIHLYLKNKKNNQDLINEVLFFPDTEYPCNAITKKMSKYPPEQRVCYNPSCRKLHGRDGEPPSSMIKFLNYLANAKYGVDLCIYMFTQSTLAELMCDLHKSNIKVRIITDGSEDEATASQVDRLRNAGVQIKSNKRGTGALMHHKFVVIDDNILLSGSFNWTNKAVVSNYEAVLVTSDRSLVKPFIVKFDEMWSNFHEHPRKKEISRY